MRVLLLLALAVFFITSERAFAELPNWVKPSASIHALDQFIEWMQNADFYRIKSRVVKEIKLESGQSAVEVRLSFDDSKGCKERDLQSVCVPLNEKTMFCQDALSDCIPQGSKSMARMIMVE